LACFQSLRVSLQTRHPNVEGACCTLSFLRERIAASHGFDFRRWKRKHGSGWCGREGCWASTPGAGGRCALEQGGWHGQGSAPAPVGDLAARGVWALSQARPRRVLLPVPPFAVLNERKPHCSVSLCTLISFLLRKLYCSVSFWLEWCDLGWAVRFWGFFYKKKKGESAFMNNKVGLTSPGN